MQSTDSDGLAVSSPPSTTTAANTNGTVAVEEEGSTALPVPVSMSGSDQRVSEGEASARNDTVEPHPKPHPDSPNQTAEMCNDALSTSTEPIVLVPSVSMETSGECAESAPSAEEPNVNGKRVSFSTPEVTSQRDYAIGEESKMRPVVKRKKSRRHEHESSQAKRKKTEEQETPRMKQTKSSGELTKNIFFS